MNSVQGLRGTLSKRVNWGLVLVALLTSLILLLWLAHRDSSEGLRSLTPAGRATPGEFATFVFNLSNESEAARTYHLSFNAPQGWLIVGTPPAVLTLTPDQAKKLFITLGVPEQTAPGTYAVQLVARDDGESFSATAHVKVGPVPLPRVEPRSLRAEVEAGSALVLHFLVTNRGNRRGAFELTATVPPEWKATLDQQRVELEPGERREVELSIFVPATASPSVERVTLKAEAREHEAEAEVKVTVLPH